MEEDIKIIENIIYNDEGKKMSYVDVDYSEGEEFINAVENLIARYKELEEENKKYPIKMNDEQYKKTIDNAQKELKEELERQINAREINEKFIETNYISKSRVKEKIEELEGRFFGYKMLFTDEQLIEDEKRLLQELLED